MKMTRLFLLSMLCLLASLAVQAQSEAFYVYRNDGQFNAFFDADVDSITYSHYDADSLYHTDWQMQVIYTADSVYQIPLEVIDSVSLVTPETRLQPGVIEIKDELRDYVLSATDSTILFSLSTPHMLLPSIGQLVVTTEMSKVFPAGFAGEVISIEETADGYLMECVAASLEDIFETFYSVNQGYSEQTRGGIIKSGRITVGPTNVLLPTPALENLSHSVEVKDDYAIDVKPYFDFSLTTQFEVSSMVIIDNVHGTYINLCCIGDYKAWEKMAFSGTFSYSKDFGKALQVPIPVCPFVSFYVEPGFFVNASVEGGFNHEWTQHYRSAFLYEYSSRGQEVLKPVNRLIPVGYTHSGEATIKGSIAAGGYVESGFAIKDKNFVNVHIKGEIGLELESNAVLYKDEANTCQKSSKVYDRLHQSGISFNWFYGTEAEAELMQYTASYEIPWGDKGCIDQMAYVPTFSDVSFTVDETDNSKAHVTVKSSGVCIQPQSVGLVLLDEDGNEVEKVYHSQKHYIQPNVIEHTFTGLKQGMEYTLYPIVHAYDMEMLASPSKTLEIPQQELKGYLSVTAKPTNDDKATFDIDISAKVIVKDHNVNEPLLLKINDKILSYQINSADTVININEEIKYNLSLYAADYVDYENYIALKKIDIELLVFDNIITWECISSQSVDLIYDEKPSITIKNPIFRDEYVTEIDERNYTRETRYDCPIECTGGLWQASRILYYCETYHDGTKSSVKPLKGITSPSDSFVLIKLYSEDTDGIFCGFCDFPATKTFKTKTEYWVETQTWRPDNVITEKKIKSNIIESTDIRVVHYCPHLD